MTIYHSFKKWLFFGEKCLGYAQRSSEEEKKQKIKSLS